MSEPRSKIERAAPANAIVPEKTCRHYSPVVGIPSRAFHAPSFAFLARPLASLPRLFPHQPTHRVNVLGVCASPSPSAPLGFGGSPPPPNDARVSPGCATIVVVHPAAPNDASGSSIQLAHVALAPVPPLRVALAPVPPLRVAQRHAALFTTGAAAGTRRRSARRAAKDSIDDVRGQVIQQTLEDQIVGTDGSWPASRSAEPSGSRRTRVDRDAAFRERQRGASGDEGGLGEHARFAIEHLRDVELEHGSGFGRAFWGGETPRAGVETRTEEDHLRGGESRERGEDGVVEESGADGDASLVASPRARTRARVSSPASAAAKGSTKSGGGSSRSDSSARSAAMDLAESVTARGFLRRSRRRVAATPAKESREEREDQRGRGERNHPHPNVDGTTRARRGVRAPGPRPTKLMRETRRRSSLLDMCLAKNRHQDTLRQTWHVFLGPTLRYDEPFPPSTPRSGTRIRAVDPAPDVPLAHFRERFDGQHSERFLDLHPDLSMPSIVYVTRKLRRRGRPPHRRPQRERQRQQPQHQRPRRVTCTIWRSVCFVSLRPPTIFPISDTNSSAW